MSARKVAADAHNEEDLTIDSSDDEYDPPPGPDDEYELDGFVVADDDDSADDQTVDDPCALDVDASNILPAGSRRTRRAARSIYDDPQFASEFAATILTDVPSDELEVAIGDDSDDEQIAESAVARKRKREHGCAGGDDDVDDDFEPLDEQSESDIEIESDTDEEQNSL